MGSGIEVRLGLGLAWGRGGSWAGAFAVTVASGCPRNVPEYAAFDGDDLIIAAPRASFGSVDSRPCRVTDYLLASQH